MQEKVKLHIVKERYKELLNDLKIQAKWDENNPSCLQHLHWMLLELGTRDMSLTKAHRWLGYIQGCLVSRGLLNVDVERDFTREIFNGS